MIKRFSFFVLIFSVTSCSFLFDKIGGNFTKEPSQYEGISTEAKALVENAFKGIDKSKLIDTHFHIVGLGKDNTGIEVNPEMKKWWNFNRWSRFKVYLSSSGVNDLESADQDYVLRIINLIDEMPYKIKSRILAFDKHYNLDGSYNAHHTEFYVPNEYVWNLSKKYPDHFIPVISVHPYRKDALVDLEKWAKLGAKHVKWLPNSMGMDPGNEKTTEYYKIMKKYGMTLLIHTGEEKAVEAEEFQEMANPLRLRKPLDMGVKILMAHMASRGQCQDLDNERKMIDCSELFWRIFLNKKYEKNLFAEMSSILIFGRIGDPINTLLERSEEIAHRLSYGSDYPLPAVNWLFRTSQLVKLGYITQSEEDQLNEVYDVNPLLFHFVLQRTVKHPTTGQKISARAFEVN